MLSCFIYEFSNCCNNLRYAKNSVKELLHYLNDFTKSLNQQSINNLAQIKYNNLLNFVTSQPVGMLRLIFINFYKIFYLIDVIILSCYF